MATIVGKLVSCIALPVLMLTTDAFVSNSNANSQQKPEWYVDCTNRLNPAKMTCSMAQTVFANNSRTRIFSATINKENGGQPVLTLALPHGLNLLEGVGLAVDEGQMSKYPIHTADINGAYSQIVLTEDLYMSMRKGNILSLNVTGTSANAIQLQMSLAGFSSAYDMLQKF